MWFIGDLANFFGAVWAGLVPTVIALAIYFCFADAALISQCLYYNFVNARKARQAAPTADGSALDDSRQPLLSPTVQNMGLPGSRRRSSASANKRRNSTLPSSLPTIPEVESSGRAWLRNSISTALIILAGGVGWVIAWKLGVWKPTPTDTDMSEHPPLGAEVLGYLSAIEYLG